MLATLRHDIAVLLSGTRRKIVAHFLAHHAISVGEAVPFVPQTPVAMREFARMQQHKVVRTGAGGHWLDRSALRGDDEARRRRWLPLVLVVALLAAAVPILFYRG